MIGAGPSRSRSAPSSPFTSSAFSASLCCGLASSCACSAGLAPSARSSSPSAGSSRMGFSVISVRMSHELHARELQELDGLLQLGRHHQLLRHLEVLLQLHAHRRSMAGASSSLNFSPGRPRAPSARRDLGGRARLQDRARGEDVRAPADPERLAHRVVVVRTPMPRSRKEPMSRCSSPTAIGSTPANGSSNRMNFGDERRLRATSALRRSPPESCSPRLSRPSRPELGEERLGLPLALGVAHPERLEDAGEVLANGEPPEDRRLLRQVADAEPRAPVHGLAGELVIPERHPAAVGRHEPDDHVERGGLAGAVRPEEADHLARLDVERTPSTTRRPR